MYYVPDGTTLAGFYECKECANRFLSVQVGPTLICPYCGEQPNMEIGPDEEMPVATETAKLISVVQGKEEVERMDALLSLAVTGGDYNWMQFIFIERIGLINEVINYTSHRYYCF